MQRRRQDWIDATTNQGIVGATKPGRGREQILF